MYHLRHIKQLCFKRKVDSENIENVNILLVIVLIVIFPVLVFICKKGRPS